MDGLVPDRGEQAAYVEKALAAHNEVMGLLTPLTESVCCAHVIIHDALSAGGKLLACGNGGSAADAQHMVAELVGRFAKERRALPAVALTTNSSVITAVANDYAFRDIFARQIAALGTAGDTLVVISTSGGSPNVVRAAEAARAIGMKVISLTGEGGSDLRALSDACLAVPSSETPRIQEAHIVLIHILCGLVEASLCS